jgi:hypothetical protein
VPSRSVALPVVPVVPEVVEEDDVLLVAEDVSVLALDVPIICSSRRSMAV